MVIRSAHQAVDDFVSASPFTSTAGGLRHQHHKRITGPRLDGEAEVVFEIDDLRLVEGTYLIDVAAHAKDGTPYDYHRGQYSFRVKSHTKDVGVYRPAHRWTFSKGVSIDVPTARRELDFSE